MIEKVKKSIICFLLFVFCLPLYGCWNYRGLDKMAIAVGWALDKTPDGENYELTFEILQPSAAQSESATIQTTLISTEGKTLFEAVRNSKKRLSQKLYFGNMEIMIINQEIAKEEGLKPVIDLMLRDGEPRETMKIIISQEKTARDLLSATAVNNSIVSQAIKNIVANDNKVTASTKNIDLYQVYDILESDGISLVLPAFHITENNKQKVPESNGTAVFKSDKLLGYLSPAETRAYLFVVDEVKGGVLTISLQGNKKPDITLEIADNKTKKSFSYEDGRIKITIDIKLSVYIDEAMCPIDVTKKEDIKKVQKITKEELTQNIQNVIQKAQLEYESDLFGFGSMIHQKDLSLWSKLSKDWNTHFKNDLDITINPEITVVNTAYFKK